jgi:peptide/nickel transport system substrate-binding protein
VFRLAESASESPDGTFLTITLRKRAKFHSGEPVTASRVRELLLMKSDFASVVKSVEVQGDSTLVIRLRDPHALRLPDLSNYTIHDPARPELRTGPFKIVSLGDPAVLAGFADYYLGAPTVARVEVREYPTRRAAWTAMMRSEVNVLHEVNPDAIEFIEAGGNIRAYSFLRPYYVALLFNLHHPVLARRDVRYALNEGVDRAEIVDVALRSHGIVAEGPFWPHHWAYPNGRFTPHSNKDTAAVRLDAAGYPVRNRTPNRMPSRFEFTCTVPQDDARFERIAQVLQRQLFDLGVDMRIEPVSRQQLEERLSKGAFDAALYDVVGGRNLNWAEIWRSPLPGGKILLRTGYTGADAPLDRLKVAGSDEELRFAVADVMQAMRNDPPAIFLAWRDEARAVDESIEVPHERQQDILGTLWQAHRRMEVANR